MVVGIHTLSLALISGTYLNPVQGGALQRSSERSVSRRGRGEKGTCGNNRRIVVVGTQPQGLG
jgi:hypothetical protein